MCAGRRLDLPVVHERKRKPPEDNLPGAFLDQIQQDNEENRMLDNTRLRIAIQKSGRLSDDSRELLARCGIKINLHTQRLIALAENMPIDILRVRDDDIPGLVMDGVVDLGIVGENVLEEELLTRRARAKIRVTLPCAVLISGAAACHWQPTPTKSGKARPHLMVNVLPPLTHTCLNAISTRKASPSNPAC
jgi:hypothetical protein